MLCWTLGRLWLDDFDSFHVEVANALYIVLGIAGFDFSLMSGLFGSNRFDSRLRFGLRSNMTRSVGFELGSGEYAGYAFDMIASHGFIAFKAKAFDNFFFAFDVNERVAINFTQSLVPEEFFGEEFFAYCVANIHISFEVPNLFFGEESGRVAIDSGFGLHVEVVGLNMKSFGEFPRRLFGFIENIPQRCGDVITSDSGVGNQSYDIVGADGGSGFRISRACNDFFFLFLAADES